MKIVPYNYGSEHTADSSPWSHICHMQGTHLTAGVSLLQWAGDVATMEWQTRHCGVLAHDILACKCTWKTPI